MDSTPKMDSAKGEDKEIMTVIGPKDLTHIVVKGKRTKRQRPQSPIPPNFTITTDYINNINSSPANSAHEFADTTTEEDEDTAKCLILLSQGPSPDSPNNIINYNINHEEDHLVGTYKFTSKKYIETSTTGNGKAGIYVYECKTCNRTFPSFQVLGGYRASHKKPKAAANPEDRKRPLSDEEEPPQQFKHSNCINNNNISSGLSLHLSNRPALYTNTNTNHNNNNIKSSSKVHECAIGTDLHTHTHTHIYIYNLYFQIHSINEDEQSSNQNLTSKQINSEINNSQII